MEAIILVGGLGTRLKNYLPPDLPKPLAPVGDRPFLDYLLKFLRLNGINRVILSAGFGKEKIRERYQDKFAGMEMDYSEEDTPLGTGGAIRRALTQSREQDVFIFNGDCLFFTNLAGFYQFFKKTGTKLALAVKPMLKPDRYGTIHFDQDQRITEFCEKRAVPEGFVSGGLYLADRSWLAGQLEGYRNPFSIETDFFEKIVTQFDIRAFPVSAYFIDIGVPQDYQKIQSDLPAGVPFSDWTLFLDRDGVINKKLGDGKYVLCWEDFEWLPGVFPALRKASVLFKNIIVVTNQRSIGRGLLARESLDQIHVQMQQAFRREGIKVTGIYVCPHDIAASCSCRKPAVGLFQMAQHEHPEIDFDKSIMIGDSPTDWEAAHRVGAIGVALGERAQPELACYPDLYHFVEGL